MSTPLPPDVAALFARFAEAGYALYLVGGAVRDRLLGVALEAQDDLDFTTDATPDQTLAVLRDAGYRTFDVGRAFGTIGTVLRRRGARGGARETVDVQITTYRCKEQYERGSRHPQVTFGRTLEEDLGRRDFSINSIAMDGAGALVDPYGGAADLERRVLRVVGPPAEIFHDDPLRILRAARFVARLALTPDAELEGAAKRAAQDLLDVSRERWLQELQKLLCAQHARAGLEFLRRTRALGIVLPEVQALVGLEQTSAYHHKDVWEHTLLVLEATPREPALRWAALLHDIGKVATRTFGPGEGEVHFLRHEDMSVMLLEGISARLRLERDVERVVRVLVQMHLRVGHYEPGWSAASVRRLVRDAGEAIDALIVLGEADCTSGRPERVAEARARMAELRERVAEVRAQAAAGALHLPAGVGQSLAAHYGLRPGPAIGILRRALEERVVSGELEGGREPAYYLAALDALLASGAVVLPDAGRKPG